MKNDSIQEDGKIHDDTDPEMDELTKELLNMKVGGNGVIVNEKDKPSKGATGGAILLKKLSSNTSTDDVPVALQADDKKIKMNETMDFVDTVKMLKKFSPINNANIVKKYEAVEKADFSTFYNSHHQSQVKGNKKVKNFNKMQNELLHEMFKIRDPSKNRKKLLSPTVSKQHIILILDNFSLSTS